MNPEAPPNEILGLSVVRLIAHGGFASVYEVEDSEGGRRAVKQLHPELRSMPGVVEGFAREADFLISKKIPGVVQAIHFDRAHCALVMELLDGSTLQEVIRDSLDQFEMHTRLLIGIRLCRILQDIHEAGSLHLDLKPDNVILCTNGRVVLTDFGVAATKAGISDDRGPVMGAINYMAPESLLQTSPSDQRTDVYSLGVLLYELLSGSKPYSIEKGSLLREALHKVVPLDSLENITIPSGASLAVERCLAFEPERRWQTVQQLGKMLKREVPGLLTEQIETDIGFAMRLAKTSLGTGGKVKDAPAGRTANPRPISAPPAYLETPSTGMEKRGTPKALLWSSFIVLCVVAVGLGLWFSGFFEAARETPRPVAIDNRPDQPPHDVEGPPPGPAAGAPEPAATASATATPTVPPPTPKPTATPVQIMTGIGSLEITSKPGGGTVEELVRIDDGLSYLRKVTRTTPVFVEGLPAGMYSLTVRHAATGVAKTQRIRIQPNTKTVAPKFDLMPEE